MADPTYRSSSPAADQTAGTFSVSKPAGTTDGDLLTAYQVTALGGGTDPATPTGWTLKDTQSYAAASYVLQRFEKLASGEGASWTFNNAGGGLLPTTSVYVVASTPGDTASEGSSKTSGNSATADPGAYSTTKANELIISAWAIGTNLGETITPDGSFTAVGSIGSTAKMNVGYKSVASAGAVANRSATISSSLDWGAILAAIPPSVTPVAGAPGYETIHPDVMWAPHPVPMPG